MKIKNFLIFPGSEAKLLKGLEKGSSGVISAVTNSTHFLARKVFDDFENKMPQTKNDQLIASIMTRLKQLDQITTARVIDQGKIKNKSNLIF